MDLGETLASHGQDEQGAEDVRKFQKVVHKTNRVPKMLEKFQQAMDKINKV